MSEIIIAPFENAVHRKQVITLWESVFGYQSAHNQPSLAIDKKVAHGDRLFFVAIDESKDVQTKKAEINVIGTIMAGYDGHRGWIYSVAVADSHRRNRIGSQLVSYAERTLAQLGCMIINLQIMEGNESVTAFYATLGYNIEKRISMGKKIVENIPRD